MEKKDRWWWRLCCSILLCLMIILPQPSEGEAKEKTFEVLIINSYSIRSTAINEMIGRMIEDVLNEGIDIRYQIEHLESSTLGGKHDYKYVEETIAQSTQYREYDLVLALGYSAFRFTQQSQLELFQSVPTMVGVLSYDLMRREALKHSVMGSVTYIGLEEYYELIKCIQPDIRNVYYLDEHHNALDQQRGEAKHSRKVGNTILQDTTLSQFVDLANDGMNQDSALALGFLGVDEQGRYLDVVEVFTEIRKYYHGPIYMVDELQFDYVMQNYDGAYPPIGGMMRIHNDEGRVIAQQLIQFIEQDGQGLDELQLLQGKVVLNYEGLLAHDLYRPFLSKRYEMLGTATKEIIFQKDKIIYSLVLFALLLLALATILFIIKSKNQWIIYQNRLEKARYKLLAGLIPDGLIEVKYGKIIYINKAGVEYLDGETAGEFIGKDIYSFVTPRESVGFSGGQQMVTTIQGRTKECAISYTHYSDPQLVTIFVIRDLTKQKIVREQKEYFRLKKEFFANLSHELRTPINVILSTSQLMGKKLEKIGDYSLQKYNHILRQNSYRLVRLVNNLIDLTKYEAGFMEFSGQVYNMVEVTEDVVQGILPYSKQKGMKVIFDTEKEEFYAFIDKEKYERILLNLLSNAIKYNREQGEILVHMACDHGVLNISIWDHGIGIPVDRLPIIFDPFVQVNKSSIRMVEGTGIGLAMVKALVDLHEGHITVESKENVYTCFTIHLPGIDIHSEKVTVVENSYPLSKEAVYVEVSDIDFE